MFEIARLVEIIAEQGHSVLPRLSLANLVASVMT